MVPDKGHSLHFKLVEFLSPTMGSSMRGISVSTISRRALTVSYIMYLEPLCVILVVFFSKSRLFRTVLSYPTIL